MNVNDLKNNAVRDENGKLVGNVFETPDRTWFFVRILGYNHDGTAILSSPNAEYTSASKAHQALLVAAQFDLEDEE